MPFVTMAWSEAKCGKIAPRLFVVLQSLVCLRNARKCKCKMCSQELQLPHNHQAVVDRFVEACQKDERIVAAFLRGSHSEGRADEYSDLDLSLITTNESYDDFVAEREAFVRLMGEPVFFEDFGSRGIIFFPFAEVLRANGN